MAATQPQKQSSYNAAEITVLKGLEAVRERPAMYIGSTDAHGLHQIFYEALDNAVDEALGKFATHVTVILHKDNSITVRDNGRGIPVDVHPETGLSALETVMTVLHAGGKFNKNAYKISGGLHGVGISCTNALSSEMTTQVMRNGKLYQQKFSRGIRQTELEVVRKLNDAEQTGTTQHFLPDTEIFADQKFNPKTIEKRLHTQAYLTSEILFTFINEQSEGAITKQYYFEKGILSFVNSLKVGNAIMKTPFFVSKEDENVVVEVGFMYTDSTQENIKTFANNIENPEGGTHLAGFKAALTQTINKYGLGASLLDEKTKLEGEDVREGLTAVISVKLPNPQYEGQTKIKLNNPEIKSIVQKVVVDALHEFFQENPGDAKSVIQKAIISLKARNAAKAARNAILRKNVLTFSALPGKLADCSTKDKELSELFVVEGDSAGGSAKQARSREFQAILPLSGKPINSEKYRLDRVLANEKLKDLVTALGCGIGEQMEIAKLRYGKVIIMTDADVDGAHIVTLVLTFMYRFMRKLIEDKRVYVAQPPLFKVEIGKEKHWFISDSEKDNFVAKQSKLGKKIKSIQRFKGLGEMNPDQLWETTMDPKVRVLKQVDIKDAQQADAIFDMLMGTEVAPRRKFILQNAKFAILDV
ncbi:MAG: DNA gyrase subunit B [Candidatus Dojkabacteria bacterium]|nr:MAG: DNA gyrase subunit B [Candidatus Dojkabacteria bacterium]